MPSRPSSEVGGITREAQPEERNSWSLRGPTWALLGGLFVLSFAHRFVQAVDDPAPWIFSDELNYWEPAKSLAQTGQFAIRDVPGTGGFGFFYPMLLAPAFLLFDRLPDAYDAVKAINSLLMSLTVLPVFLLTRRYAGRGLALAAAGLSVAIPAMTFTGNVMTENAFYPLIAFWLLALVRALERPTLLRQVAVVALILVGVVTKIQAVVLVPAMAAAIAIVVVLDALEPGRSGIVRRVWRGVLAFWPTWALLALAVPAAVIRQALRDQPIRELLGAYGGVADTEYPVSQVATWALYHLAALDIFVGVVPFAAFLLMGIWSLRPAAPRELRILAAVGVSTVLSFLLVVSAFATTPTVARILERNFFHVLPLFFIAFAAWVGRGAPRPWWAVAPAALFAATMTLALPLNNLLNAVAVHSTPGLLPLWRWRDRAFSPESIDDVVACAAIVLAVLFVLAPRRLTPLFVVLLALYFVVASRPVEAFTHKASLDAYITIGGSPRDWVDREVGRDADVGSFYWAGDQVRFWEAEFFNDSIGPIYSIAGPYDGLPGQQHVGVYPTGVAQFGGVPLRTKYILTDLDTDFGGKLIADRRSVGLALYEINGPLVVRQRVEGLYPDRWSGSAVAYTRYGCEGGTLELRLTSHATIHGRAVSVQIDQGQLRRVRIPRSANSHLVRIRLIRRDGGVCYLFLTMPTGSAAASTPGDLRQLGLLFESIRYVPPR